MEVQAAGAHRQDVEPLLELAREALVVLGPQGDVRFWNAGAERILGIEADSAIGRPWAELVGEGAAIPRHAVQQLKDDGSWSGELQCLHAAHRVRVECACAARFDEHGGLAAIHCAMVDVTEQRRAEKEIVLLNKLMEQRISKRTEDLEESNEALRVFAYSLAHDLRAPLASIDGFSAQLERTLADGLDEKSLHYLRRVRAGVKLMSELTDGLLGLADIANTELLRQEIDLSALARNVIERLRESQPGREVVVTIADTPRARGDVRLLDDVLQNLLGNAWKFTSKTHPARIEFGSDAGADGHTHYYVKDNGAGFDPEYAHKLFGPFQRLHTVSEFEGTGIGLAIVRKIVTRHGGRVWAEGAPGAGAVFRFTLD